MSSIKHFRLTDHYVDLRKPNYLLHDGHTIGEFIKPNCLYLQEYIILNFIMQIYFLHEYIIVDFTKANLLLIRTKAHYLNKFPIFKNTICGLYKAIIYFL